MNKNIKEKKIEDFYEKNKIIIEYLGIFLIMALLYILVTRLNIAPESIKTGMITAVFLIVIFGGFFIVNKKEKNNIIFYIILLGFIMRIGYMLYTPCDIRQHDIGEFEFTGYGHASYILNMLKGHLPYNNTYQFYHPPFFYFVSAVVIKIISPFCNCSTNQELIDIAKLVSCFSSCGILLLLKSICKELKLDVKSSAIALAMCAFVPNLYLVSGRVNNDGLAFFFAALIILYSIKWINEPSMKNILVLAFAFGFGIMTKISVASLAVVTGLFMIIKLYKAIKEKKAKSLLKQYVYFALIAFPLGWWYGVRNYILFKQPLTYVYEISKASSLYCGDVSFFERFIKIDFSNLFAPVYQNYCKDYNVTTSLLRGSVFGEFIFSIKPYSMVIRFIYIATFVVALFIVFSIIINLFKQTDKIYGIFLTLNVIVSMGLYIMFNIQYPFRCTMDFRYILPVCICSALLVGKSIDLIKNKTIAKVYSISLITVLVIYSVLSVWVYVI